MLDRQAPDIKVVANGRDDIVLYKRMFVSLNGFTAIPNLKDLQKGNGIRRKLTTKLP